MSSLAELLTNNVFVSTLLIEPHFKQSLHGSSKTPVAEQTGGDMKCIPQMSVLSLSSQDELHTWCKDTLGVQLIVCTQTEWSAFKTNRCGFLNVLIFLFLLNKLPNLNCLQKNLFTHRMKY